jgi:hypothetical protein
MQGALQALNSAKGINVHGSSSDAMVSLCGSTHRWLRRQAAAAVEALPSPQSQPPPQTPLPLQPTLLLQPPPLLVQPQPLLPQPLPPLPLQQPQQPPPWLRPPQLTMREREEVHHWLCRVATVMRITIPPKRISIKTLEIRAPPPQCIYEVFGGVGEFATEAAGMRCCDGYVSLHPAFHQELLDDGMGRDSAGHAGQKRARQH